LIAEKVIKPLIVCHPGVIRIVQHPLFKPGTSRLSGPRRNEGLRPPDIRHEYLVLTVLGGDGPEAGSFRRAGAASRKHRPQPHDHRNRTHGVEARRVGGFPACAGGLANSLTPRGGGGVRP
jgi:hypothetical protein